MAAKLFCITNESTAEANLIWANKPADAMAVVLGDDFTASVASDEQLYALGRDGQALHPAGMEVGAKGSRFVLLTRKSTPDTVLIRAASPSDGIARFAGAALKVALADQLTIVTCMAAGVQPSFAPGVDPGSVAGGAGDASGSAPPANPPGSTTDHASGSGADSAGGASGSEDAAKDSTAEPQSGVA